MKKWSFFSFNFHVAAAKSLQLCLTLCDPIDGSPPGSSVHGTLQARTLEWVAISFSRRSFRPRDWTHVCLLHWQASSLPLSHQGKKWLLLWTQLNVSYFTTNSYHYWAGMPNALPSPFFTLEVKVKSAQSCPTLYNPMDCPWNSPGQNPCSHSLLHGIFSTQGLNPGLPHCRQILY